MPPSCAGFGSATFTGNPVSGAGSWCTARELADPGPGSARAYLFEEGRALLWWYMEEVRAEFCDDPDHPEAQLFPSERIPQAVWALNIATPGIAVTPSAFRRTLKLAGHRFLTGPVTVLHPHLLRHACATHKHRRAIRRRCARSSAPASRRRRQRIGTS